MRSALVILLVVGAGVVGTLARRSAMSTFLATRTYEDVYYLPNGAALPALSLGYREALADLIWLEALVYTGDEFANHGDLENVFRYADAMLVLDPRFRAVYTWVGTMGTYRPVGVTLDDHRRTIAFIERGTRVFPTDGTLRWDLGAAMSYELAPLLPAGSPERLRLESEAREQFIAAARLGGGPEWIGIGAAMSFARAGQIERALEHLRTLHAMSSDPATRARIEARIAELEGHAAAETMRASANEFEVKRRAEFPYVSEGLYMLLAPRIAKSAPR